MRPPPVPKDCRKFLGFYDVSTTFTNKWPSALEWSTYTASFFFYNEITETIRDRQMVTWPTILLF